MSEHTPGPWRVFEQPITDRDEAKRELIRMVDGTPNFQPVLVYVTDDNWDLAPAVTGCGERSLANARLIAAAPDLLDALKRAESLLERTDRFCEGDTHKIVKAAIAKATGRWSGE